ncbi:MAG: DUF4959 domain-containing protein [Tannerella sp.]|jgi:hypothetical protein|nr:DUF4959 domain-containing protein [Tannerella sp.]
MNTKILLLAVILPFALISCNEETHSPLDEGSRVPLQVINPVSEPLPGAVKIKYQLPNDKSLLYVRARSEIRPGVFREEKSSYYTSEITLDGFGDTDEHTVYLYSVGRNEVESSAVAVKARPDTPPIFPVYQSIQETIQETFGGIKFGIKNPTEASVRIYVNTVDSLGEPFLADIIYTSAAEDNFSVRGYEAEPRYFSVYVQDRWGNTSDVYENTFNPWIEKRLNKLKWTGIELPGDMTNNIQQGRVVARLWDEGVTDNTMYQTMSGIKPLPHTLTIDLGVKAVLSRIVVNGRASTNDNFLYNAGAPKQWDIYGSEDPNPDGSFDDWYLLNETPCESFKPSALPLGQHSDDDYQRQLNGEEYEFSNLTPVRYIRMSINQVWGGAGTTFFNMQEITLYGTVLEDYY